MFDPKVMFFVRVTLLWLSPCRYRSICQVVRTDRPKNKVRLPRVLRRHVLMRKQPTRGRGNTDRKITAHKVDKKMIRV